VVAELAEAVDRLAGIDPAELSDAALASELLEMRAQMDRLEAVFANRADAAHRLGVPTHARGVPGSASCGAERPHAGSCPSSSSRIECRRP
jgi:hypothetical protein